MTKNYKEIQTLNESDLMQKLQELQKDTIKLKAQVAIGTVPKNALQIRNNKRAVARILTLLQSRALGLAQEQQKQQKTKSVPAPEQTKEIPKPQKEKVNKKEETKV